VKILLLDIETISHTVRAWGLHNQFIAINQIKEPGRTICYAYKWLGEKGVAFDAEWLWEGTLSYASFLEDIHKALDDADVVITYNGKSFDIPTLNKEFVLYGFPPPAPSKHIDLYQVVKRKFRFASKKLDFVCQALGLGSKTQHKGMELWNGVEDGDPKSQATMEKYNKQDVILLEKLYKRILPWISNHPSVPLHKGLTDARRCPSCGGKRVQHRGFSVTRTGKYRRYQCTDCGSWGQERFLEERSPKEVLVSL